jgi:hypothetical protein
MVVMMRVLQALSVVLMMHALPVAAQTTRLNDVEKVASAPPTETLSDADLGLPADPDAPKTAELAVGRSDGVVTSEYDADKIVGNAPVSPPLAERIKRPSPVPEDVAAADLGQPAGDAPKAADLAISRADAVPTVEDNDKIAGNPVLLADRVKVPSVAPQGVTEADLGQPAADAPKAGDVAVSLAAATRRTIYDDDKIDGNEPLPPPLEDRVKAPAVLETPVDAAALGQPAGDAPKTADLAASLAEAVPTTYDDDKITGNEPPPEPLLDRQKFPGNAVAGLDAATLGTPATDAPKTADLAVSLAADGSPSVDDNDKIAGNPYVLPPMNPRSKLPSVLPDPVVDADLGQPAEDAPKAGEVAVSHADGVPNIEDNDKIAGNPVVWPPLTDRVKAPSFTDGADLTPDDLGLPADEAATKTADLAVARSTDAVTSTYDEDKITDNAPVGSFDSTDLYTPTPPDPEIVAKVRAVLEDPAAREIILGAAVTRTAPPTAVVDPFKGYIAALLDQGVVRDRLANDIAQAFVDFGLSPDNPQVVARIAAEQFAVLGGNEQWLGLPRLPVAQQRAHLADMLRISETLAADQCAPYLEGALEAGLILPLELTAMAGWPRPEVEAALIRQAGAVVAELQDNPPFVDLSSPELDQAAQIAGERLLAAIDALPNGTDLLRAYGDALNARPGDRCAVHQTMLRTALAIEGADGDLVVRYLVTDDWAN